MDPISLIMMIVSIIQMLMELFTPKPPPTPTPIPDFQASLAHVQCVDPQWQEIPSGSDAYVTGSMVQNCTVKFDALNLSSDDSINHMTGSLVSALEENPANTPADQVYQLSSSVKRDFRNQRVLNVNGQQVPTAGTITLTSDQFKSLSTKYTAQSLPTRGDASYLKSLQTATQYLRSKDDPTLFLVRVIAATQVQRPFLASASKFKAAFLDNLKSKVGGEGSQAVERLIQDLR